MIPLTLAQAAELVGVSPRTIRAWVQAGHLRPVHVLGRNYYAARDVIWAERVNRAGRTRRGDRLQRLT